MAQYLFENLLKSWNSLNISFRSQAIFLIFELLNGETISDVDHLKISEIFNKYSKSSRSATSNNKSKQEIIKSPSLLLILDSDLFLLPIERTEFMKSHYKVITRLTSIAEAVNSLKIKAKEFKINKLPCFFPDHEQDPSLANTIKRLTDWLG